MCLPNVVHLPDPAAVLCSLEPHEILHSPNFSALSVSSSSKSMPLTSFVPLPVPYIHLPYQTSYVQLHDPQVILALSRPPSVVVGT